MIDSSMMAVRRLCCAAIEREVFGKEESGALLTMGMV